MWELRSKDQFGRLVQVQKENCFTKQPVYDNIDPNEITCGCNTANLKVEYTVEWLPERNFEAFEKAQLCVSDVNPWELNNEYLTDSLGLAIRMMMLRELDDKSGKPRLYMYIKAQNGKCAEACTEIPSDTVPILRNMVQENINRKLSSYEENISALKKELELYQSFIKKCHAEKALDDYRREIISLEDQTKN